MPYMEMTKEKTTMKKLLATILAFTLILSLAGCGNEPAEPYTTDPRDTEAKPAPEPEVTEAEPPIEITDFCPEEDMPSPFSGDAPADFSNDTYAVSAGGGSYTPQWLYYHNIYDWYTAGITFDQVNAVADDILGLPFNDDALTALKSKISDFTMIMMLETPADVKAEGYAITIDDASYDIAWLSSHNATEYKDAGIPAATVKELLDALHDSFWYTYEYRWMEEVYSRLTK